MLPMPVTKLNNKSLSQNENKPDIPADDGINRNVCVLPDLEQALMDFMPDLKREPQGRFDAGTGNTAYQNKDITSKLFAERFQGKSLNIYGLNLPPVRQALPTNIPQIIVNELRIDNVFLLEDDTIAVIDYESDYKKRNKHKYVRYVNHVSEHYGRQWKKDVAVRMIVIYSGCETVRNF